MKKNLFTSMMAIVMMAMASFSLTSCNNDDNYGVQNAAAVQGNYSGEMVINETTKSKVEVSVSNYYLTIAKFPVQQIIEACVPKASWEEALKSVTASNLNLAYVAPNHEENIPVTISQTTARLSVKVGGKPQTILVAIGMPKVGQYSVKQSTLTFSLAVTKIAYNNEVVKDFKGIKYQFDLAKNVTNKK